MWLRTQAQEESETPQAETGPEILVRASHPPPQKFHNPATLRSQQLAKQAVLISVAQCLLPLLPRTPWKVPLIP